jgi:hypothetical protein
MGRISDTLDDGSILSICEHEDTTAAVQGHVSQDALKRYILEQEGMDVFDYSLYENQTGQTKIGDFTK